jgi:MFS transporter, FSR family, fosmidomycin resistance protein
MKLIKKANQSAKISRQIADYQLVIVLGLAHAASDCVAGYLIGNLSLGANLSEIGFLIGLYNLLAFAGQMPAGLLVDQFKKYQLSTIWALMLTMIGLLTHSFSMFYALILIGLGSAFFHVSGGALIYAQAKNTTIYAGIFAGPGVLGLILGGWLAINRVSADFFLAAILVFLLVFLLIFRANSKDSLVKTPPAAPEGLDTHDIMMILLLLAIAMRSAVWNIFQLMYAQNYEWLFYLAIAGMLGKIAGAWLAEYLGERIYALLALGLAIPLLFWSEKVLPLLVPGVFLLQSTTPIAMLAIYRILPHLPATAAGASLGMGIALGGFVFYLGVSVHHLMLYGVPFLGLFAFILYYLAIPAKPKFG